MVQSRNENPMTALLIDITANFISGGVTKTLVAPFERAKIILQTQRSNPNIPEDKQYKGFLDALIRVGKEEGFLSLFRGNLANVLRHIPTTFTNLFGFIIRDIVRKNASYSPKTDYGKFFLVNLASGGAVGAVALLCVYPLDYTRTRLAADVAGESGYEFSGHWDCIKKTVAVDGISGLYAGFNVSMFGIIAYRALYFGLYDSIRDSWAGNGRLSFGQSFLLAQVVTTSASLGTYPLDTIRRRMMMEQGKKNKKYNGAIDCAVTIVKEEGVSALFAGALSNQIRTWAFTFFLLGYTVLMK